MVKIPLAVVIVAGILCAGLGLVGEFPSAQQRLIMPAGAYTNFDSHHNEYFWVTDEGGTRYSVSPSMYGGLRRGLPYLCEVHVYLVLLEPGLVRCTPTESAAVPNP